MYFSHAVHNRVDTLQNKVDMLQDKVVTVQDKVINLEDKLDTFQNTTEANTVKHHHEVVELLQNTSCSLDSKSLPHFQVPTLQIMGEPVTLSEKMQERLTNYAMLCMHMFEKPIPICVFKDALLRICAQVLRGNPTCFPVT